MRQTCTWNSPFYCSKWFKSMSKSDRFRSLVSPVTPFQLWIPNYFNSEHHFMTFFYKKKVYSPNTAMKHKQ